MIHDSNATVNPPCPRTDDRLGASCVTLLPRAAMHKITTLDDHWMARPRSIGTALLESDGHHAIVDPGPGSTLNTLRHELRAHGVSVSDLDAILLTHIHLDHAGASGALVRENPRVIVYVHKLGAPHMVDPSKLLASAARLWPDNLGELFGEAVPVPESNLQILEGRETITLGSRKIEVAYTPGHAAHHVSYFEDVEGVAFDVLEIADVVRGVAWRVGHLDFARAERNGLSTFEDLQIRFGHGHRFSEQLAEIVRPKPRRACQQLRRIHHVRRAEFVDVHNHSRIFPYERAASAGVVQVNVGQQNRVQVAHRNAVRAQLVAQRV